jgi:hypothetical protein
MNKMTGIIIMGVGVVLFALGAIMYKAEQKAEVKLVAQTVDMPLVKIDYKKQMNHVIDLAVADGVLTKNEEKKITELALEYEMDAEAVLQEARTRIELSEEDSETEIINHIKKSGDDFEKFVVQKFNKEYFNVVEWAGDKYVDGIYADTTLHPDLLMELNVKNRSSLFYVECKWRKEFKSNKVSIASKKQFDRYKQFEKDKKLPVFISLGIGGKAGKPDFMYTLPLRYIETNILTKKELIRYERAVKDNFFFNVKKGILE